MGRANYKAIINFWILRNTHYSLITQYYSVLRNATQWHVDLRNVTYYAMLSILRKLDDVIGRARSAKTNDSFVNDFRQEWKFWMPAQGHVVNSIRPGGHLPPAM